MPRCGVCGYEADIGGNCINCSQQAENLANINNGGSGTKSCFLGDVDISVPGGTKKMIDVSTGDLVLSKSINNKLVKSVVIFKPKYDTGEYLEIAVGINSVKIKVTGHHKIHTDVGYKRAECLSVGDGILIEENGIFYEEKISNIANIKEYKPVFNIVAFPHMNFIAGGVVSKSISTSISDFIKSPEKVSPLGV